MIEILRMINKEKNAIEQKLAEKDDRLEFYRSFFQASTCTSLDRTLKCNRCDLAIAIIIYNAPNLNVQEVKDIVYNNENIFKELNNDSMGEMAALLSGFQQETDLYQKVKTAILKNEKTFFSRAFKKEDRLAESIKRLAEAMQISPKYFIKFIDLTLDNPEPVVKAMSTVATLRTIEEEKKLHDDMFQEVAAEKGTKIKNKTLDKLVAGMIRDDYNIKGLLEPVTEVREEYISMDQKNHSMQKELNKRKNVYERLEVELYRAVESGEVTNISAIIKKVPSDEIRLAVLKYVYKHNFEIYTALQREYETLSENDTSHYQVLLAKYGISPEVYEVGTVMANTLEELEQMLEILARLKITKSQDVLAIVQSSNLETMKNVYALAEKGIIKGTFISENPSILNSTLAEYNYLMHNLNNILSNKVNPHAFIASQEVLLTESSRFEANLKKLEEYDLLGNIKTGSDLSFLREQELATAIDTLLELGYEKNLEECLSLLNHKAKFKRLYVLKSLNIPISSTEELLEVLTTDKFYVPDKDIDSYIYDAAKYHLPKSIIIMPENKKKVSDITKLTDFSATSRTYNIDGVIVSKNKVHRNLANVAATGNPQDRLLYGVLKGSILSDEEVNKVKSAIVSQTEQSKVFEKNKN